MCAHWCNAGLVTLAQCSECGTWFRNVYRERLLLPGSDHGSTCMYYAGPRLYTGAGADAGVVEPCGMQRKRFVGWGQRRSTVIVDC